LLVGLPGSGKSTWAANKKGVISSDAVRELLADDPTDQTIHRRVFAMMRALLRQRLELKRPITYIDATSLTLKDRRPWIRIARRHRATIEARIFATPLAECQRRNALRGRIVPPEAISAMNERCVLPSKKEGFARVTTARTTSPPRT
jgi:predicted kinase